MTFQLISESQCVQCIIDVFNICSISLVADCTGNVGISGDGIQPLVGNVMNKQMGTGSGSGEAQYMQQQSQIFVFSTALANKGADAVLQGQYPSIIAYHCAQPGTKKYLEVSFIYQQTLRVIIIQNSFFCTNSFLLPLFYIAQLSTSPDAHFISLSLEFHHTVFFVVFIFHYYYFTFFFSFIQKHPNKVSPFRQNPAQWLNNLAVIKQKSQQSGNANAFPSEQPPDLPPIDPNVSQFWGDQPNMRNLNGSNNMGNPESSLDDTNIDVPCLVPSSPNNSGN